MSEMQDSMYSDDYKSSHPTRPSSRIDSSSSDGRYKDSIWLSHLLARTSTRDRRPPRRPICRRIHRPPRRALRPPPPEEDSLQPDPAVAHPDSTVSPSGMDAASGAPT